MAMHLPPLAVILFFLQLHLMVVDLEPTATLRLPKEVPEAQAVAATMAHPAALAILHQPLLPKVATVDQAPAHLPTSAAVVAAARAVVVQMGHQLLAVTAVQARRIPYRVHLSLTQAVAVAEHLTVELQELVEQAAVVLVETTIPLAGAERSIRAVAAEEQAALLEEFRLLAALAAPVSLSSGFQIMS